MSTGWIGVRDGRVLITNDDGIDSPGLRSLAEMARSRGHDVQVAAPAGTRRSEFLGDRGQPDRRSGHRTEDLGGMAGSVGGGCRCHTRTDRLPALHERLGQRPDIVLSGINRGPNTGRAILHSGTVGAAFTAYQQNCPGLAVSSAVVDMTSSAPVHWETAAIVAGPVFDWLAADGRCVVLDCNVPDVPVDKVLGLRAGGLAIVGASQTW